MLTDLSILIFAEDHALLTQLKGYVTHAGSAVSAQEVITATSYDALGPHLDASRQYDAVILAPEKDSDMLVHVIDKIRAAKNGPLIVVHEDTDIARTARERGVYHLLPAHSLVPELMESSIASARDHFNLTRTFQQMEEHYSLAEQRFKDVVENFSDWLWEIDEKQRLVFSSSKKRPVEKAQVGALFTECFLPEEATRVEDDLAMLFKEPKPFSDIEYWSADAYGTRVCWALSGVPVYDKQGGINGYRGVARDISQSKSSVDQLYFLANNDALTGLYNRSRFTDELVRIVRQHKRRGCDGALIVIDIDRFKYVNDTYGHEAGDKLIVHVAQMLKETVRASDFVARIGGDEFAVVVSDTRERDAIQYAQRLLDRLNLQDFVYDNVTFTVSASAGVVEFPQQGRTADELISRAGVAVTQAKRKGRGRPELYDSEELNEKDNSRRLEWLNFMARCLEKENDANIVLHFQPIVPLAGPINEHMKIERYEVLVRLMDEMGDLVSPLKFIDAAEEFGMISKIDRVVATRAIDLLKDAKEKQKALSLSVNISARTFDDKAAVQDILTMLDAAQLPPGALVFELTETAAIRDLAHVRTVIEQFKGHGAAFALDDCGVGYSSFNYIRHLDVDYIKIDGSFIRDLHRSAEDDAFVCALRDVARRMRIYTVAEWVEHPETVEHLKKLGIDFAQGYHFGMPGPNMLKDDDNLH